MKCKLATCNATSHLAIPGTDFFSDGLMSPCGVIIVYIWAQLILFSPFFSVYSSAPISGTSGLCSPSPSLSFLFSDSHLLNLMLTCTPHLLFSYIFIYGFLSPVVFLHVAFFYSNGISHCPFIRSVTVLFLLCFFIPPCIIRQSMTTVCPLFGQHPFLRL